MYRAPSFGEDSYDFLEKPESFGFTDELIKNSKITEATRLPTISTADISEFLELNPRNSEADINLEKSPLSSVPVTTFSQSVASPVAQPNISLFHQQRKFIPTSQNTLLTRMMSVPRDSILESLESIAPKFPPQDVDIPDISVTNGLQMAASSAAVVTSGFSTGQIYGSANTTSPMNTNMTEREASPSVTQGNTGSPAGSSVSNMSNVTGTPPQESSEDSDDSVPLAQVCLLDSLIPEQSNNASSENLLNCGFMDPQFE